MIVYGAEMEALTLTGRYIGAYIWRYLKTCVSIAF
jgi:hypothetical protein